MSNVNHQPIPTLYVNNIESKVKKDDVVAAKGSKMRGQAFVVFEEISAATAAMRALVGEEFYGRPLRITYAKSTSNATLLHEDPEAALTQANKKLRKEDRTIASRAQGAYEDLERERQEEEEGRGKRERGENGDVDGQSEGDDAAAGGGGDDGAPEKKRRKVDAGTVLENGGGADADEEEMEMDDE
ncbi:hypothetical protein QFC24_004868 [Naganishia onofrii]|uniref:Uncharacterized protein n=1 Tax=Naganishia onofrii TaxID=1851511 RepID=A0ACC2XAZ3_9TREE|nr:hypothetical protein QFC24_004868 [Naganishia onofrii]